MTAWIERRRKRVDEYKNAIAVYTTAQPTAFWSRCDLSFEIVSQVSGVLWQGKKTRDDEVLYWRFED
ncbi:MAG TPA: hypothetical protein VFK44_13900 [Bacillales bacterium]|nr:hypothetical protein [Bacillales bacterium]